MMPGLWRPESIDLTGLEHIVDFGRPPNMGYDKPVLGSEEIKGVMYDATWHENATQKGSYEVLYVMGYLREEGERFDPNTKEMKKKDFYKYPRLHLAAAQDPHISGTFLDKFKNPDKKVISCYYVAHPEEENPKIEFIGAGFIFDRKYPDFVVRSLEGVAIHPRFRRASRKYLRSGTNLFGMATKAAENIDGVKADMTEFSTSSSGVIFGVVPLLKEEPYNVTYVPVNERLRSDGKRKVISFLYDPGELVESDSEMRKYLTERAPQEESILRKSEGVLTRLKKYGTDEGNAAVSKVWSSLPEYSAFKIKKRWQMQPENTPVSMNELREWHKNLKSLNDWVYYGPRDTSDDSIKKAGAILWSGGDLLREYDALDRLLSPSDTLSNRYVSGYIKESLAKEI